MTVRETAIKDALMSAMPGRVREVSVPRERRVWAVVERESLPAVVQYLADSHGMTHLATSTCVDDGDRIRVHHHLMGRESGIRLTVTADAPKADCWLPSITGVIPGALQYEAEIWEMMGVDFRGHPGLFHVELPDDWGDRGHPLRKDFTFERRKYDE